MGYTLGLGGPYHHDGSACIVDDEGAVVAFVEEERISRHKYNRDSRGCGRAAAFCLERAGIQLKDLDAVAVAWNPYWPSECFEVTDADLIGEVLPGTQVAGPAPSRLEVIDHHLAHAASSFYVSGFRDAAVVVADGHGDGLSTTIFRGTAGGLELMKAWDFTHSLGWAYEHVAAYLGLGDWSAAGKLMGLCGYGRPSFDLQELMPYLQPDRESGGSRNPGEPLQHYYALRNQVFDNLSALGVDRPEQTPYFDTARGSVVRRPVLLQQHKDVAASIQAALESALLAVAEEALQLVGTANLCLAGGVALNCTANGALRRKLGTADQFIPPAAGDAGCALGAALESLRRRGRLQLPMERMRHAYLGPSFSDSQISGALRGLGLQHADVGHRAAAVAAEAIARGATVGWFQGQAEVGPRALGARSILANPTSTAYRDRVNMGVKNRESWRPLAPSLLAENATGLMKDDGNADFMIQAYLASDALIEKMPATVHVDGTVRPHIVDPVVGAPYAGLLRELSEQHGISGVLNTSFNDESEPIVCSPRDAVRTFFSTGLDELVIGSFHVRK